MTPTYRQAQPHHRLPEPPRHSRVAGSPPTGPLPPVAAEIDRQAWGPSALVHVGVSDGIATLNGVLVDDRMRAALRVLAENICGVGKVRDRLTTIEPMTGAIVRTGDEDN